MWLYVFCSSEHDCTELPAVLLSYSRQIALGMVYLTSIKQYIHRDLAARNVLVSDEYICKVHFQCLIWGIILITCALVATVVNDRDTTGFLTPDTLLKVYCPRILSWICSVTPSRLDHTHTMGVAWGLGLGCGFQSRNFFLKVGKYV